MAISIKKTLESLANKKQDKSVLLWTNPNPSSAFTGKTVTLSESIDHFSFYMIIFRQDSSNNRTLSVTAKVGTGTIMLRGIESWVYRSTDIPSGTSLSIHDGKDGGSVNNNAVIPVAIYGLK